jgi:hypothetical protein
MEIEDKNNKGIENIRKEQLRIIHPYNHSKSNRK